MSTENLDFENIDALLDASMDDLDDLPPVGVPPSGHYNFTVTFGIKEMGDDKKQIVAADYVVDAINELKDEDERSEVAIGQQFTEFFYVTKKDGTKNTYGIGTLKARLAPYAERFGETKIGELVKSVKQVAITATVKRRVNRKNEDHWNVDVKDVVLL
jgi:hypothetical protein